MTWEESSAKVYCQRAPSSPSPTAATRLGSRSAQRWTQFQAIESFEPTNHVAHSGPRERSMTWFQGVEKSSPMSSIAAGQNHSGSSCERRTSSQ